MVDFRGPPYQFPHRKPLPPASSGAKLQPLTQIVPDSQLVAGQQAKLNSHSRTRTSSSSVFPQAPQRGPPPSSQNPTSQYPTARRTLSNATTSTSTSGGGGGLIPARTNSSASVSIRRSTSSRSAGSPTGYVALMRKQKATVWCDRAQHEDPRLLAQQKAAKMRAALEVVGARNSPGGRTSTSGSSSMLGSGGVRSKIRHHGAQKAVGYTSANLVGGGVPLRLSASEVGDDANNNGGEGMASGRYHQRSGSGKSSVGSNKRQSTMVLRPANSPAPERLSSGSTPPSQGSSPDNSLAELAETPVPKQQQRVAEDYFTQPPGNGTSGSSGSSENTYTPYSTTAGEPERKTSEELRRRGSVDDRTMTMSGVRLFVANPDLSD